MSVRGVIMVLVGLALTLALVGLFVYWRQPQRPEPVAGDERTVAFTSGFSPDTGLGEADLTDECLKAITSKNYAQAEKFAASWSSAANLASVCAITNPAERMWRWLRKRTAYSRGSCRQPIKEICAKARGRKP